MIRHVAPATLEALRRDGHARFRSAQPFPHIMVDDFLRPEAAEAVLDEFDTMKEGWTYLVHVNERKQQLTQMARLAPGTRALIDELQSPEFIEVLERFTGIRGLIPDPDLDGSGLHEIKPGGFLNMHVDFLAHTVRKHWSRQLNLLIYLNKDWQDAYNGHLEFWDRDVKTCEKKMLPIFNRCVVFQTSDISFHGHPAPLACPPGRSRRSVALYYYRDEGRVVSLSSTNYRPLPGDRPVKRLLIAADRFLLRVYALLKRYTGLSDSVVNAIMKRLRR